jgi:hypothetical protein
MFLIPCFSVSPQRQCEEANQAASDAMEAKREGDLQGALKAHAQAAKQFHDAAVRIKDRNGTSREKKIVNSVQCTKSLTNSSFKIDFIQRPWPVHSCY